MITASDHELTDFYRGAQESLLQFVADVTDEQLRWQATPETPPMIFHVWHIIRWDDGLQAWLARKVRNDDSVQQIWQAGSYAERWGFPSELGEYDTGKGIEATAVNAYPYPEKAVLVEYVQQVCERMLSEVQHVDELSAQAADAFSDDQRTMLIAARQNIVGFMTHIHRHLGCMEALKGVLTGRGMKV